MAQQQIACGYGRSTYNGGGWQSYSQFTQPQVYGCLPAGRTSKNRYVLQLGFYLPEGRVQAATLSMIRRYLNTAGGLCYAVSRQKDSADFRDCTPGSTQNAHGTLAFKAGVQRQSFALSQSAVAQLAPGWNYLYFWSQSSSQVTYMEVDGGKESYPLSSHTLTLELSPMRAKVQVGGAWREVAAAKVQVGGAWKEVLGIRPQVGGAWRE